MSNNLNKSHKDRGTKKATDGRSILKEGAGTYGPSAFLDQVFVTLKPKKQEAVTPQIPKAAPAGDLLTQMLAENPEISGATFLNLLKSKGFIISPPAEQKTEADMSSANLPAQRAGLKKETKAMTFRTRTFLESQVAVKDNKSGSTRYNVVLIEEGMGNFGASAYYSRKALESGIPVFEGRKIYADHPQESESVERPERSVRDILGHFESVKVIETKGGRAQLVGTVVVMGGQSYQWARELMEHSVEYAKKFPDKEFVGLSINASGDSEEITMEEAAKRGIPDEAIPKIQEAKKQGINTLTYVSEFKEAVSCDLVTEAGAGGKILNLIEGKRMETEKESQEGGPGSGRRPGGGSGTQKQKPDKKSSSKLSTKDILSHVNDFEKSGKGNFDRSGKDLTVWVKGGDWSNARALNDKLGGMADIQPDKISGKLRMTYKNVYSEGDKMEKETENKEAEGIQDGAQVGGDAPHADTAQDMDLFKKMIHKYVGDKEQPSDEECGVVKEAYEAHKAMGFKDEEAESKAVGYMQASKHMAAKREAAQQEAAAKASKEASAGLESSADDKKNESDKSVESDKDKESGVKKESNASKSEVDKLKEENAKLTGELASFKESDKKKSVQAHIEKICKESKLTQTVTSSFKKLVETAKSVEEVDKTWGVFQEGYRSKKSTAEGGLDFGSMTIESEKTTLVESAQGGGVNFGSCVIED